MVSLKELKVAVESVSNEKGVSESVVLGAIEAALATATKKKYGNTREFRVDLDWDEDTWHTFRTWTVVDPAEFASIETVDDSLEETVEVFNPDAHLTLEQAHELDSTLNLGDVYEEQVESVPFGRIDAQTAKQVIVQRVREAERERVAREYEPKIGTMVKGTVKRTSREAVIVDLGDNAEGILTRDKLIPRDTYRPSDRVVAYLESIDRENRGPQLILSREHNQLLIELFKVEVPEVNEHVIEIRAAARDPGRRAKIAVSTNDGRIDAVGACVGMRGSRVQAVSGELSGERVDVVQWDSRPEQLAINALGSEGIIEIRADEDLRTMDVVVADEKVSVAIGDRGENVRLASELCGWRLQILTRDEAERAREEETDRSISLFMTTLDVDEELAAVLAEEGFISLEEVAYVPIEEMRAIEGFDDELIQELRQRAKASLDSGAAIDEYGGTAQPADDLLNMRGMDSPLAWRLAAKGIVTMEDLAELSTPDLMELDTSIEEERAKELIMTAREPWFKDEEEETDA